MNRAVDLSKKRKMTEAVNQLIIDRKFQVAKQGTDLFLIKMVGKRPVTIFLKNMGNGYFIEPPKHEFRCTYSHFEFTETERRFTRRKDILLRLVDHLQKTKMWDFILNKGFFAPNPSNSKMNKKVVGDQYYATTGIRV